MKFFGKELPTDKINFVMNVVSFILGVIFFIRMQHKMDEKPQPANFSAERDSMLVIQTRVNTQLKEIRQIEDSLTTKLQRENQTVSEQKPVIAAKRRQLYYTLHSDWDNLSQEKRDAYVNQLMSNLSKAK